MKFVIVANLFLIVIAVVYLLLIASHSGDHLGLVVTGLALATIFTNIICLIQSKKANDAKTRR
jgi:ABC-type Fe3+-siderophore transport system permease subunit